MTGQTTSLRRTYSFLIIKTVVIKMIIISGLAILLLLTPSLLWGRASLIQAKPALSPKVTPFTGMTPTLVISTNSYLRPEITPDYITHIAQNEIGHGNRNRPALALTFDCEGNYESIKKMVDLLDVAQAKGTFFLLGRTVAANPQIVPLILAGGHELGNHSYNHPRFTTLTYTQVVTEVTLTENIISEAAGKPLPMRYFRFPYGNRDQQTRTWLAELGYQSIFWDIDPQGWRKSMTATQVISTVVHQAQPGSIVLMHCGRLADETALPTVITELQAQGYALETLSQILPPDEFLARP